MYSYICGKVAEVQDGLIVLEANGIGYEILVTDSVIRRAKVGESEKVFTYLVVREDAHVLCGFSCKEEKQAFLMLLSVSGIGAKLALTVLSGISFSELAVAIACNDTSQLTKIKGVGKKTAERMILELKEKLTVDGNSINSGNNLGDIVFEEAVLALIALGIPRSEAVNRVKKHRAAAADVQALIALCLKG